MFPYLGVGDGQAVHWLGYLKQLDLLYHVGLRAQDHHSLQPALRCSTHKRKRKRKRMDDSLKLSSSRSLQYKILPASPQGNSSRHV